MDGLADSLKEMIKLAVTRLPKDVLDTIKPAYDDETSDTGKKILKQILDNIEIAEKENKPICQDTGIPLFYVEGKIPEDFEEMARKAVKEASEEIPLRPNIVDPITRENKGNTSLGFPCIKYFPKDINKTIITFCPKGGGSENMSRLAMLKPSQGFKGVEEFILRSVAEAGANPCPPIVVGVGIGGSADLAMDMAKKAILKPLDKEDDIEQKLKDKINRLGIGPMGLGGKATALAVKVLQMGCHTASLPVAVNIQCWAARRATGEIEDGRFRITSH